MINSPIDSIFRVHQQAKYPAPFLRQYHQIIGQNSSDIIDLRADSALDRYPTSVDDTEAGQVGYVGGSDLGAIQ